MSEACIFNDIVESKYNVCGWHWCQSTCEQIEKVPGKKMAIQNIRNVLNSSHRIDHTCF